MYLHDTTRKTKIQHITTDLAKLRDPSLTDEQMTMLIGQMYEKRKKQKLTDPNVNGYLSRQLAEEIGVSEATVRRAYLFKRCIDTLRSVSAEAAEKVLQGGSGTPKHIILGLDKKSIPQVAEIAEKILSGQIRDPEKRETLRERAEAAKESRADTEDLIREMCDPTRTTEYTIEMLVESIELNGNVYVDLLRNTIEERKALLDVEQNRGAVYRAITDIQNRIDEIRRKVV